MHRIHLLCEHLLCFISCYNCVTLLLIPAATDRGSRFRCRDLPHRFTEADRRPVGTRRVSRQQRSGHQRSAHHRRAKRQQTPVLPEPVTPDLWPQTLNPIRNPLLPALWSPLCSWILCCCSHYLHYKSFFLLLVYFHVTFCHVMKFYNLSFSVCHSWTGPHAPAVQGQCS